MANADDSQSKAAAFDQIKSKGLGRIQSADDLDWVIVGEQFSDCMSCSGSGAKHMFGHMY